MPRIWLELQCCGVNSCFRHSNDIIVVLQVERYAMLAASKIAGLTCLRLMAEPTATALAYGIYKTDLPEKDPVNVAFIDMGHQSTQV